MPLNENTRKVSAFSDTEITRVLAAVIDFEAKFPDISLEDDKKIVHLVNKLRDALSLVKHFPFSSATVEVLAKAGIVRNVQRSPLDRYCPDDAATLAQHAARYRSMLAQDAFMSAENFDGLFNMIVRRLNLEAGSRMLVDAFLLRVAAMQDQRLLLIFPEYAVPITQLRAGGPDDTFAVAGKLDYLLVLLSEDQERRAAVVIHSKTLLRNPRDFDEEESRGFAIVQAKSALHQTLSDAVPQAVLDVAAFAKKHKKTLMSGVVTNGLYWMFFSFKPSADGVGGTYKRSPELFASSPDTRAVITGILKDMIDDVSTVVRLPAVPVPPAQDIGLSGHE